MKKKEHKKSNFSILVVDDSSLSGNVISEILTDAGFTTVEQCNSAQEAIDNPNEVHCYIVDVVMPKKSGIELAKEITSQQKEKCILMISSLDSENILIESIASGAKDFLKKPFSKDQLIFSMENLYKYAIEQKIF